MTGWKLNCKICGQIGNHITLSVPEHAYANHWLCDSCFYRYEIDLKKFNENYFSVEMKNTEGAITPPDQQICF